MRFLRACFLVVGLLIVAETSASSYDDMIQAIKSDDRDAIESLLSLGFDPNSVDPEGNGLLHLAARDGHADTVRLLLKYRVDVNRRNRFGETPLMLAALRGREEIVDVLLEKDADLKGENWTALLYAAFGGHVEIAQKFLERGAPPDELSGNGSTPLMMAADAGSLELVDMLLKRGANPMLRNMHGRDAVDWAMEKENTDVAERIRQAVALQKALSAAAAAGENGQVRKCLDDGANPNLSTDEEEQTPLLLAAQNGHLETARLLLSRGARLDQTNKEGETAVMLAAYNGHVPVLNFLASQGALFQQAGGMDALSYSALNCQPDTLAAMLKGGASPDHAMPDGTSLLLIATQSECVEGVKLLLERGASPLTPNMMEMTPLSTARAMDNEAIERLMAETLLKRFVNEWVEALGSTPGTDALIPRLSERGFSLKIQGKSLKSVKELQRWRQKQSKNLDFQSYLVEKVSVGKRENGVYPVQVEMQWRGAELDKAPQQRNLKAEMSLRLEDDGAVKLLLYREDVVEQKENKEISALPGEKEKNHGVDQLP